jgi:hypothetical protein
VRENGGRVLRLDIRWVTPCDVIRTLDGAVPSWL